MKANGLRLRIVQDQHPDSPRGWDNLGTIAYAHREYVLGEEEIGDPIRWLEDKLGKENAHIYNNDRLEELEEEFFEKYIALPLYLYDHSGLRIRTHPFSCRWDSGKVGYIYVDLQSVRENYGVKRVSKKLRQRVLDVLMYEVKTFDQHLSGDVYGFIVEDEDGKILDSCYGFYGDDPKTNGMMEHLASEYQPLVESAIYE